MGIIYFTQIFKHFFMGNCDCIDQIRSIYEEPVIPNMPKVKLPLYKSPIICDKIYRSDDGTLILRTSNQYGQMRFSGIPQKQVVIALFVIMVICLDIDTLEELEYLLHMPNKNDHLEMSASSNLCACCEAITILHVEYQRKKKKVNWKDNP